MYIYAMENENVNGIYNAVATMPVTNKQLTLTLAEKLRGKFCIPIHVPEFILKIVLGESSIEVLKSTSVSNQKITSAGFTFLYPTISTAIEALAGNKSQV
jgi:NAD dependent epimerase/dehydratase family enzyme